MRISHASPINRLFLGSFKLTCIHDKLNRMNDTNSLIARAIIGGSYLIAATILFVGVGIMFINDPGPENGFYFFIGGILLTMVFLGAVGIKTLNGVSRELKK